MKNTLKNNPTDIVYVGQLQFSGQDDFLNVLKSKLNKISLKWY